MGTRHLIVVQAGGEYKVAQYGQWDGYPSGQGLKVLSFLAAPEFNKDAFTKAVRACSEISEGEYQQAWANCGAPPDADWVDSSVSAKFRTAYPYLHRDCGADILLHVMAAGDNGLKLNYTLDFAADSLFCEWVYVVDLDKNTFEVFEGGNTKPLDDSERFANIPVPPCNTHEKYYQVKLVNGYSLDKLPTPADFLEDNER